MKPHVRLLLIFLYCLVGPLLSCVSVKLTPEVQKSKDLIYNAPSSPFAEVQLPPADRAWKSSRTGNVISYFSECSNAFVPLERLRDDVLSTLPKATLLSSDTTQHDGREALLSQIEGNLDGIPMRVSLLVYQKNGCRYSLSYTGRKDRFDQEAAAFTNFQQGFKAP